MNLDRLMAQHSGGTSSKRSPKSKSKSKSSGGKVDLDGLIRKHSLPRQSKRSGGRTSSSKPSSSVWTGKGEPPEGRVKHRGSWGKWITFGRGTDKERTVFRREAAPSKPKDAARSIFYKRVIGVLKDEEGMSHTEAMGEASKLWHAKVKAESENKTLRQASKATYIKRIIPLLRESGFSQAKAKKQAEVLWEAKSSKGPRMVIDASKSRKRPKHVVDASKSKRKPKSHDVRHGKQVTLDQIISRYSG